MSETTMAYRILIQSERSAAYLESRIEKFLEGYKATLDTMTEQDFQRHVTSLINKKLEKVKNLNQESMRYWAHMGDEFYDFHQREYLVQAFIPSKRLDTDA